MKLIESATQGKGNPQWLSKGKCLFFRFDTGHTMRRWNDGDTHFASPKKVQLNNARNAKIQAEMLAAIKAGI